MLSCFLISGALFIGTNNDLVAIDHIETFSTRTGYVMDQMEVVTASGNTKTFNLKGHEGTVGEILTNCAIAAKEIGDQ